jgi:hypothetical protein
MEKPMFKNMDKIKGSIHESIESDNGVNITIGQSYSTTHDEEMKISVCMEKDGDEIAAILTKEDATRLYDGLKHVLGQADKGRIRACCVI